MIMDRKALLAAALMITIACSGCAQKKESETAHGKQETQDPPGTGNVNVKQEVYAFKVEGFNEERKAQWRLEGKSADVVMDEINIRDLKAVYYGEDMTFTLWADRAVYNKKTHDIELTKNIIGKTSDGGEFITNFARWNAKTEEIKTDSYVIVKRENITCMGAGLITRPRLKYVAFTSEIEVTIAPDKKITCDGPFELNHKESVAIFHNNVRITDPTSEILTDKLTIYLNPETNEMERFVTEGNVRVVHRGELEKLGEFSF
jgi:LPS export ABC transporter protein LptC